MSLALDTLPVNLSQDIDLMQVEKISIIPTEAVFHRRPLWSFEGMNLVVSVGDYIYKGNIIFTFVGVANFICSVYIAFAVVPCEQSSLGDYIYVALPSVFLVIDLWFNARYNPEGIQCLESVNSATSAYVLTLCRILSVLLLICNLFVIYFPYVLRGVLQLLVK